MEFFAVIDIVKEVGGRGSGIGGAFRFRAIVYLVLE